MPLRTSANLDDTLEDGRWKDSFDKLLEDKSILRERKVLKKTVRATFNLDSSFENSPNDNNYTKILKRQMKNKNIASTPSGKLSKQPFKCAISPIVVRTKTNLFGPSTKPPKSKRQAAKKKKLQSTIQNPSTGIIEYNSIEEKTNQSKKEDTIQFYLKQFMSKEPIEEILLLNQMKLKPNTENNANLFKPPKNKLKKQIGIKKPRKNKNKLQSLPTVAENINLEYHGPSSIPVEEMQVSPLCLHTEKMIYEENFEKLIDKPNNSFGTSNTIPIDNIWKKNPNALRIELSRTRRPPIEGLGVLGVALEPAGKKAAFSSESTNLLNVNGNCDEKSIENSKTDNQEAKTSQCQEGSSIVFVAANDAEMRTIINLETNGKITIRKSKRYSKKETPLSLNEKCNLRAEEENVAHKAWPDNEVQENKTNKLSDDLVTIRKSRNSFKNLPFTTLDHEMRERRSKRLFTSKSPTPNELNQQTLQNNIEICAASDELVQRSSGGIAVLRADPENEQIDTAKPDFIQNAADNLNSKQIQKSIEVIPLIKKLPSAKSLPPELTETPKSSKFVYNNRRSCRTKLFSKAKGPAVVDNAGIEEQSNSTATLNKQKHQQKLHQLPTLFETHKSRSVGRRALYPVQELVSESENECTHNQNRNENQIPEIPVDKFLEKTHHVRATKSVQFKRVQYKSTNMPNINSSKFQTICNDSDVILIENEEEPSKNLRQSNQSRSTTFGNRTQRSNPDETHQNEPSRQVTVNLSLQPGKWRKSLRVLRRSHSQVQNQRSSHRYIPQLESIGDEHPDEESVEFIKNSTFIGRRKTLFVKSEATSFTQANEFPKDIIDYKERVLRYCEQTQPLNFHALYAKKKMPICSKIGEGVYGEVFMKKVEKDFVVCKIIPIEGESLTNGEAQKTFEQILPEIMISKELCKLKTGTQCATSGFVDVKKVACVKGKYPQHLIECWEKFDKEKTSENDHPKAFNQKQLFIVLELEFAGKDLEAFIFNNAEQSYAALQQIVMTLAVAEEALEFEHRDLHWGNVLMRTTDEAEIQYKLNGETSNVPTKGIRATIIDYTLSRMKYDNHCFYNDLANDEDLFAATGDYQFDIYRMMRDVSGSNWERFVPKTNVFWISYIISKILDGVKYKNSRSKMHTQHIQKMLSLKSQVLNFEDARSFAKHILKKS